MKDVGMKIYFFYDKQMCKRFFVWKRVTCCEDLL